MQTIDPKQSYAFSAGALLAGAAFFVALAVAAPGEAFAGCGSGGASTGAHSASSGGGGTHSGASAPAGSSGGGASSCGGASSTGGALTPSLAGVHTGIFTGNGTRKKGVLSRTASLVTATRTSASTAGTVHIAGGTAHASFVRPARHR